MNATIAPFKPDIRTQVEPGLKLMAISCAISHGVGFSPNSGLKLDEMIRSGLQFLQNNDELNLGTLEHAQLQIVVLVAELARETEAQANSEILEEIFDTVRKRLCPLPPWIRPPCR